MAETLVAIRCPRHGASMERSEARTPEQAFCGAWWRCSEDRCGYTVLFDSPSLRAQWRDALSRTTYRSSVGSATERYMSALDAAGGAHSRAETPAGDER